MLNRLFSVWRHLQDGLLTIGLRLILALMPLIQWSPGQAGRSALKNAAALLLAQPVRKLFAAILRCWARPSKDSLPISVEPIKPRYWRGIAGGRSRRQKPRVSFRRSTERKRLTEHARKMANCPAASSIHPSRASN